jgi:hypothetical protein
MLRWIITRQREPIGARRVGNREEEAFQPQRRKIRGTKLVLKRRSSSDSTQGSGKFYRTQALEGNSYLENLTFQVAKEGAGQLETQDEPGLMLLHGKFVRQDHFYPKKLTNQASGFLRSPIEEGLSQRRILFC